MGSIGKVIGIGMGSGQASVANNSQMYTAGNEIEPDFHAPQLTKKSQQPSGNDNDPANEDIIMMNIPREGFADQLNKSTKLTLSSKKAYDNTFQNLSYMNNQPQM
jgi:hypothetical protein